MSRLKPLVDVVLLYSGEQIEATSGCSLTLQCIGVGEQIEATSGCGLTLQCIGEIEATSGYGHTLNPCTYVDRV